MTVKLYNICPECDTTCFSEKCKCGHVFQMESKREERRCYRCNKPVDGRSDIYYADGTVVRACNDAYNRFRYMKGKKYPDSPEEIYYRLINMAGTAGEVLGNCKKHAE